MGCHHQHKGGAGGVVIIALGVLTGVSGREVSSFRDTIVEKSRANIYFNGGDNDAAGLLCETIARADLMWISCSFWGSLKRTALSFCCYFYAQRI